MSEFIQWCNENQGFLTIVLSALTLLVSIIAIIVSLHTARLPYKKKLLVKTGNTISSIGLGLHVTATNVGNRNIKISNIGFLIGNQIYINKNTLMESLIVIGQGDTTSQYYDLQEFRATLADMKISPSTKIYAFVEDTEGTRYKKKLTDVKSLFAKCQR